MVAGETNDDEEDDEEGQSSQGSGAIQVHPLEEKYYGTVPRCKCIAEGRWDITARGD